MTAHTGLNGAQQTSLAGTQAENSANALHIQHATPNANTTPWSPKTMAEEKTKQSKTTAVKK